MFRQCFITSRKKFFGSEIGYRIIRVINAATCVGRASATQQSRQSRVLPADSL